MHTYVSSFRIGTPSAAERSRCEKRSKGEAASLVSHENYGELAYLKARWMQAGAVGIFVSELVHHFALPPIAQSGGKEGTTLGRIMRSNT